jgi:signal transduction histidine kinase
MSERTSAPLRPAVGGIGREAWAALAAGGILLLALVAAAVWLAAVNAEALGAAARTHSLRDQIGGLVRALTDAETGQRGYLLTGSDAYLAPYEQAIPRVPVLLDQLAASLPQDDDTRRLVARLHRAASAKLDELDHTVALARGGDRAAALGVVATGRGKALMEEVREVGAALAAEQDTEWTRLTKAIRTRERRLVALDAAGAVLAAGIAWSAARAIRHTLRALRTAEAGMQRAYAAVQRTNANLESEIARRTGDLRAANEEIQRFAYIVSHDLRAPLVNVMGFTAELEAAARTMRRHAAALTTAGGAVPPELEEAVERDLPEAIRFIRTSTDKMDRLIGAILRLSREGRRLLQPERVAMGALVRAVLDSLAHQVQEAGAQVEVGLLPDLVSDRLAVEQVFTNLLDNALKYRDPGRPLRLAVRGRVEGEMRVFEIEDTGRGIAERDRERIFELFRRAGGQTLSSGGVPGEGVGLAHARALVRRLGGRIELDSAPGRGSVFRLHFPAAPSPALDPSG